MSKCPMCGTPATFEIRLPEGASIPCASLTEANGLLRTHQRQWPNEDLSIVVVASPNTDTPYALELRALLEEADCPNGMCDKAGTVIYYQKGQRVPEACPWCAKRDAAFAKNPTENRRFNSGSLAEVPVKTGGGFESREVAQGAKGPDGTSVKAPAESGVGATNSDDAVTERSPTKE